MRVLLQICKEFWLPFICAITWSLYNLNYSHEATGSIIKFVNIFGATFFLVSWLTGQSFRICKQTKTENDLQSIHTKITSLLQDLETKVEDIVGYITGGESFCYLTLSSLMRDSDTGITAVIHKGKHPLYDVTARIVDLDIFETVKANLTWENMKKSEMHYSYGQLVAGFCKNGENWNLGTGSQRSFNIFWAARNGGFTQLLRFRKIGDRWYYATKVERGTVLLEQIQDEFPRNKDGGIDW